MLIDKINTNPNDTDILIGTVTGKENESYKILIDNVLHTNIKSLNIVEYSIDEKVIVLFNNGIYLIIGSYSKNHARKGGDNEVFESLFKNDNFEIYHSQNYVNIVIKGKYTFETEKEFETVYTFKDKTCIPPSNIVAGVSNPFANSAHAYCIVHTNGEVRLGCAIEIEDMNIYGNIFYHKKII